MRFEGYRRFREKCRTAILIGLTIGAVVVGSNLESINNFLIGDARKPNRITLVETTLSATSNQESQLSQSSASYSPEQVRIAAEGCVLSWSRSQVVDANSIEGMTYGAACENLNNSDN